MLPQPRLCRSCVLAAVLAFVPGALKAETAGLPTGNPPEKFSPTDLASFGAGAAIEVGVGRLADGGEQLQRRGHRLLGE